MKSIKRIAKVKLLGPSKPYDMGYSALAIPDTASFGDADYNSKRLGLTILGALKDGYWGSCFHLVGPLLDDLHELLGLL